MEGQINPSSGDHHAHGDEGRGHSHESPSLSDPRTMYVWRVHHPVDGVEDRVAVEVSPRRGLLPRWRFVVPAEWESLLTWGVGEPGGGPINPSVKRPVEGGPVNLVNGPRVWWFGGHETLSSRLSAYLMFEGEPPHYLAFGQADEPDGPPTRLEGITFGQHDAHPGG